MFKFLLIVVTAVFFNTSNANATITNDKWVADGIRLIKPVPGNGVIITHPISVGDFDTLALCEDFIESQKSMNLGVFKGSTMFSDVVATCSQTQ